MKNLIFFVTLSSLMAGCFSVKTKNSDTDSVKNNLKRIINTALDALVNIEDNANEVTTRSDELSGQAAATLSDEETARKEIEEDDSLSNEIKDLEKILDAAEKRDNSKRESRDDKGEKHDLLSNDMREAKEKRDDVSGVKENTTDKRETASREEKATVVMDNDSLRDLVDLVVRAIDEEARREEKKDMSGRENSKREIIQEEKRALHRDRKEKKEVIEEKKRDETNELCNTRKRECVQKKSSEISADTKVEEAKSTKTEKKSIEDKIESKKTAEKSVAVEKKVEKKAASVSGEKKKKEDSNEIREMVEEILNGKNDEEREAFASLLESVFERTTKKSVTGTSADQQKEKKNKDE